MDSKIIKSISEVKISNGKILSLLNNSHIEKMNRFIKKVDELYNNVSTLMKENCEFRSKIGDKEKNSINHRR